MLRHVRQLPTHQLVNKISIKYFEARAAAHTFNPSTVGDEEDFKFKASMGYTVSQKIFEISKS